MAPKAFCTVLSPTQTQWKNPILKRISHFKHNETIVHTAIIVPHYSLSLLIGELFKLFRVQSNQWPMASAPTDRTLYKSLLIFPQSRGNSNQEHYYVLIQNSYTEGKSSYLNSIYKLLHWQVYVTEQRGRALLAPCMCECTHAHIGLDIAPFQRGNLTSLKSAHFGYRNRELPTPWTRSTARAASTPVHSCPSWLAATVVTSALSHSASATCLALTCKA